LSRRGGSFVSPGVQTNWDVIVGGAGLAGLTGAQLLGREARRARYYTRVRLAGERGGSVTASLGAGYNTIEAGEGQNDPLTTRTIAGDEG
jgi:monoamine oxidase